MSVSEILFIVAGLLVGLSFLNGMFLFLIPFAVVAFVLAWMNRPRLAGPGASTATLPVITLKNRATGTTPVVAPDLRSEFRNGNGMANEPEAALKVSQVWARANADINRAMMDLLLALKGIVPNVNSALVFSQRNAKEWGVRNYVNDKEVSVNPSTVITETSGLLSQLFRSGVDRLLEGDLPGCKSLQYYVDNTPIKSVVAVPLIDHGSGVRVGALILDSVCPNAFNNATARALTYVAGAISMLDYKGFYSAQKHIALQQYSGLYNYLRKFFKTMSVNDIYKEIINYVRANMAYDRLTIMAMDKDKDSGRVIHCDGVDADQFVNKRFTLSDKGIFVLSIMRNRPMERSFLPGFKDYLPRLNDSEKRNLNLRQIFVMPIAAEHDAATADIAICLESSSSLPYNDHEKELLKAFASVAGFAYDRACKFEMGREQAMRDGHTGLINKKTLFEKLRAEKSRADRGKYSIGVLMMDIDHFKSVNDTYGHPIGDVVIKGIADTISKEIRSDIDIVARFGGEEFVVGLIETDANGMVETAERIRKAVQKLSFDIHQAEPLRVTVSIGAFLLQPNFNGDLQKAVNNADQALYRAKEGGRNQVVQFQTAEPEPATV
ncbi:sensor domain-containing diguanylate cyclase [Fibrobacter sp. UWH4]|uniref:sensor domain-containing diguanylate cyclase n=1 Tax=Fibrobacter sp. UWH4 TaxID=1896210 RepID=UPI0009135B34|nr:sensor domain-containing diguanylate cyclase [Fibrobacter sp. UWH4]SHK36823.1 diguanylate cyclase (GGDEF) domain-containing protein [Fibrobacter sp. UWH4]